MKSKIKILLIGRLTINNTPCAGEVVKNQLFLGRIRELFDNVTTINLTYLTKRIQKPFLYLKMLWILLKGVDTIIVSTYDEMAAEIIAFWRKFGKSNKLIYWVIGGGIAKRLDKGELDVKIYKGLSHIIVEDTDIEKDLKNMGIERVSTVPNFKPVFSISAPKKKRTKRFVYMARITPLKGCDIILSAAHALNRKGLSYSIDFYGFIENGYPFEEYVANVPNVSYKGIYSFKTKEDYEYLYNNYDALLFPTFYPNEGFPGTLIDGYMAGLPIVTTQWRYNSHFVEDTKSGWLVPIQDSDKLAALIEQILLGKYNLDEISNYNLRIVKKYDVNELLSKDFFSKLGIK